MLIIESFFIEWKYTSPSYPITPHDCVHQIEAFAPYSNSCAFIGNEDHVSKDEPRRFRWSEVYENSEIFLIIVSPSTVIFYESYYIKYPTKRSLSLHYDFNDKGQKFSIRNPKKGVAHYYTGW